MAVSQLTELEFAGLLERAKQNGRIDSEGVAERFEAYSAALPAG